MSILKKLYFQNVLLPIPNAIGRNIPATHSRNLAEKFLHDFRAFRCFNAKNRKKSKNFKFNRSCSYFNCALPWWSPTSTENLGPTGQSTWEEIVPQQTNRQTTGIPLNLSRAHYMYYTCFLFAHLRYQTARLSPHSLIIRFKTYLRLLTGRYV